MTERGVSVRLFLTTWIILGLHFATNTVREIYPALSLGDHLSFDVSEYLGFHDDIFAVPGRGAFINNNPGASILGAIPYLLARPVTDRVIARVQRQRAAAGDAGVAQYDSPWPMAREFYRKSRDRGLDIKFGLAAALMSLGCMAPLSALSAVVMYWLLRAVGASRPAGVGLALLYIIATPVLFRSAQLNQNLLVSHCALLGFAALCRPWAGDGTARPRYFLAGLLAGWSVVCDYSGMVVVLALSAYAAVRRASLPAYERRVSDLGLFMLGLSFGGVVLMGYQWSSFGNPFFPAQHYMPPAHHTEQGYVGFSRPHPDLLWATVFDYRFGLFTSAPLLLLALWPAWMRRGSGLDRPEVLCIIAMVAGFLVFCSANQYGRMQFNTGVRHVVPAAPFLFLAAAIVLRRMPVVLAVIAAVIAAGWTWSLAMYRDVELGRGVLECVIQIARGGLRLPWLTTLQRLGFRFPHGASTAWVAALVVLLTVIMTVGIWVLPRRRAQALVL